MTSILIMGSSHINRFEHYIQNRPALNNLNIQGNVTINYFGISGGQVLKSDHCQQWETAMQLYQPEHLVVQIGGNDLDSADQSVAKTEEIIYRLVSLLQLFKSRYNVRHVTILQFINRTSTRNTSPNIYNQTVIQANRLLKTILINNPNIHYWNLRGVKNSYANIFLDGVHFNNHGNFKYFRNIRGAITTSLNRS